MKASRWAVLLLVLYGCDDGSGSGNHLDSESFPDALLRDSAQADLLQDLGSKPHDVSLPEVDLSHFDIVIADMASTDRAVSDILSIDIAAVDMVNIDSRNVDAVITDIIAVDAVPVDAISPDLLSVDFSQIDIIAVDAVIAPDDAVITPDVIAIIDAAPVDAAIVDALPTDMVQVDAVPVDAVPVDAVPIDAVPVDAVPVDVALIDMVPVDAAIVDAIPVDVAPIDVVPIDAAPIDAAPIDAALVDAELDVGPDAAHDTGSDAGTGCPPGGNCSYHWSSNLAIEPAIEGKQRCETALTTDAEGQVWLSYLDTDYHETRPDFWIAWPRDVVLWRSQDQGMTFEDRRSLRAVADPNQGEGDESLASDALGNVYAAWVQYDSASRSQKIVFQRVAGPDGSAAPVEDILPWSEQSKHDQAHLHVGADGSIHLLARDIANYANVEDPPDKLLYARSQDQGATFQHSQRLPDLGGNLPQLVSTQSGLLIVGPRNYIVSHDDGISFGEREVRFFTIDGGKLVRIAVGPERRVAYLVTDSVHRGIQAHITENAGETWRIIRVDDGRPASAWRYPVVHVDSNGRVHVIWMDDRSGSGAVYHAYSDDEGRSFSTDTRVSDVDFSFPVDAPAPPPASRDGNWIGDYHSITTAGDRVIVAWADQRAGHTLTTVYISVARFEED